MQNQVQQALSRLPSRSAGAGVDRPQIQPRLPARHRRSTTATDRTSSVRTCRTIWRRTCRTRSAASPASAIPTCSARNMRCGSGSIPTSCSAYQLMPSDVITADRGNQNTEVAAGELGGQPPSPKTRSISTPPSPPSRAFRRPSKFRRHHLEDAPRAGATVRHEATCRRIELGARRPTPHLQPRSNRPSRCGHRRAARTGGRRAQDRRAGQELRDRRSRPRASRAGYQYIFVNDSTDFIKLSIEEVVKTLIEAIILVVIVMFVFLQSWRATLIPDDRGAGGAAWHLRRCCTSPASRSTR